VVAAGPLCQPYTAASQVAETLVCATPGRRRRRRGQARCTTRVGNQRRARRLSGLCATLRPMNKIGYARVSTRDQDPQAQVDALERAGCARVFVDHGASGRLARRPELDRALDYLRPGDQLVITKLDRIGRSVRHLIELAGQLAGRDVDLVVLHQAIDTSTPGGRLFFHLLAAFAEFEADLASERTRDGLEAARARGRAGGRRPKLNPRQVALARQLYDSRDHTVQAIAETFGVDRATIYRHLGPAHPTADQGTP
jgi:DNA invertase Pin-like site-specific DNA recombinase